MNAEHIAPLDLPALPLAARAHLPEGPAIYFVIGEDDAILYIGRASSLRSRWMTHHRRREFAGLGNVRIAWLAVSDTALLDAIEDACVAYFMPRLNGTRISGGDVRIMLSLPPEIAAALKARAKDEATPVSVLVRRWIVEELRRGRGRE